MGSNVCLGPSCTDGTYMSFLHLPIELRQQIYRELLELHPRVERELPGYPARSVPRYVTVPIKSHTPSAGRAREAVRYRPLPSWRPLGYIPHSLLRTCKQIYYEARTLPFNTNEFVFTPWMSSATSYCEAVVRPMEPWQRDAVRHVRFAVAVEELSGRSSSVIVHPCQLERVCALLPGVRTMRISLSCAVFPTVWFATDERGEVTVRGDWGCGRRWIDEGLRKMSALRVLEIEFSFPAWMASPGASSHEKKRAEEELAVRWCGRVDEILNEGRSEEIRTRVVAVAIERHACSGLNSRGLAEADDATLLSMHLGSTTDASASI